MCYHKLMEVYYHKLTETELRTLVSEGIVSEADANRIVAASRARTPGEFAKEVVKVPLDRQGNIQVRSIHFYGGENFNRPHHFVAEVVNLTTNSVFSRFLNRHGIRWVLTNRIAFTY